MYIYPIWWFRYCVFGCKHLSTFKIRLLHNVINVQQVENKQEKHLLPSDRRLVGGQD